MPRTVVLLPGLDGTGEQFAPLVDALGPNVSTQVVRYPDTPMDYEAHRQLVSSILPRDQPYVILGESFSGPIAISLAAKSPRGLLGCILCASFVRTPREALRLAVPFLGAISHQRLPSALSDYLVIGRFATPALQQMQRDAQRSVSPATLVARLRAIACVNVSDQLRSIALPMLYMRATEDRLVPRSASQYFSRLARAGRVVDLEGPHFLLQARPREAAAEVQKFVREVG